MKKSVLLISLLSGTALLLPNFSIASELFHTYTYTPKSEPAFEFAKLDKALKFASVCFLGFGDCDPNVGFGSGEDNYDIDPSKQCMNEGFVSSCSSGYCLDNSCPYDNRYGRCLLDNCPSNSSTSCSGTVVGRNNCGQSCKKCCDNSCPSGYTYSTSAECFDTTRNECGTLCYKAKDCDPCPGYYECGGAWQYCEGKICPADSSRCSVYCKSDYFPYKCDNRSDCKGIYRNGYCSGDCTPECVETCTGETSAKTGEGWTYTSCTTCDGQTLYTSSAKPCPSGYSTSVDSCDTSAGYRLTTSGKSGDSICGRCTNSSCPDGYDTSVTSCNSSDGYALETNGVSGGQTCGKCVPASCPDEYSTDVTSCSAAYTLKTSGKSGGKYCRKCECTATDITCSGKISNRTTYEEIDSCTRNGQKYVACGACTRTGGTAEGFVSCLRNGEFILSYDARPNGATVDCNGVTYYESCGCDRDGWKMWNGGNQCGPSGYPTSGSSHKTYNKSGIDYTQYYHRGYLYNQCYDNGFSTYNGCALYYCSNPNYKVIDAPENTCATNETLCCCPGNDPLDPACVRVDKIMKFPDDEL